MSGKFEVYQDRAGKYRWRLKRGSGQVCATGEAHETREGARGQCLDVMRAASGAKIEEVEA